jgi:hypothetical protein
LGYRGYRDVVEMRFVKLLRNLKMPSKHDPSCMRPVEALIRTVGGGEISWRSIGASKAMMPTVSLSALAIAAPTMLSPLFYGIRIQMELRR